jgi:hypothetical protein
MVVCESWVELRFTNNDPRRIRMELIKKFDIQNPKFHIEYSIVEQRMLNIEPITDN